MKVSEIRSSFLEFFNKNSHEVVDSSPLVPQNDPTLLFANAGMNQFKDLFLGKEKRPYTKAVSCQKCVRAGGKHNDLENVGYTARHHTFFEMLGNFSFGDYFKEEAITMAWEFVTKHLKLDTSTVYVTVFETDDEAEALWTKKIGLPKDRVIRLGEADNFWSMGDVGPCGPCSEIFVDRGKEYCCGDNCGIGKCECDRFMEFWNLVFMQYNRDADGNMTPLPKPSVDTGMGLERIAGIIQKTQTNYEIDAFIEILNFVAKLADKQYDPNGKGAFNFRVIADHARATTFLINDGVMPSNEGRGYVLRRIIRRAVRYGRNIGFSGPFLNKVCMMVIDQMKGAYPDLEAQRSLIERAVVAEEEQFFKTLEKGLSLLDEELSSLGNKGVLSGDVAFRLYDTFGFPVDLTRIICAEKNISVDEAGFEKAMARQKEQSRKNWKGAGGEFTSEIYHALKESLSSQTTFSGYDNLALEGTCLGILQGDEKSQVDFFGEVGATVEVIFDQTPFYPEGGGQVGDRGKISGDGFEGEVIDVRKPISDLIVISVKVLSGAIKVGSNYTQETDSILRSLTARNHTATHMLHWALRKVLGDHVKQAGSLVNEESLRFDFSHFQSMTSDEIEKVEELINQRIAANHQVAKQEMHKDEAVAAGAIAFFGEKYGDSVRVVSVGDYSVELCGGCHVQSTAEINLFKITSEASIAAGVRRITALTSERAIAYLLEQDRQVRTIKENLKLISLEEIESRFEKSVAAEKELRKQLEALKAKEILGQLDEVLQNAKDEVKGTKVVGFLCPEDEQGIKTLREIAERLTQKEPNLILLLAMKQQAAGKALLLAAKGKQAPKTFKSGDLIKKLCPVIDGRGGGKPDMAQAGGTKIAGIDEALATLLLSVQEILG